MKYDTYRGALNTDLLWGAQFEGCYEIPTIRRTSLVPNDLIPFDKAISSRQFNQWVHFYIHDYQFLRIWRNPWRYLPILLKFEGAISPDFSVMWDYPLYKQLEAVCHSRELGSWMQRNGIPVIPNVRWGKEATYGFAFDGIELGGTVAVGTVGCMRDKESREVFERGFGVMLERVVPSRIVVYGSCNSEVFQAAEHTGVEIVAFECVTTAAHRVKASCCG